ncbi:dUTP diphosphatase [Virgibacillus sp. YIM 98842]|uniref:dUTP diphosphatase n=1 Tax=Virgibacillus sp. YIM 98842 TaxID=2663533 RepID=UPI0013DAAA43|nr:dUTP diphosphatase [Virgibacillus sp. YIM 98842]
MNLQKLIDKQGELLNFILQEKNLNEQDVVKDTFLALQVELGEFANEGRWFKYWSEDQSPKTSISLGDCIHCNGKGFNGLDECTQCNGKRKTINNPLLEEYVDGMHFFLQVAILNKWEDALFIFEEQLDPNEFDGKLTEWLLETLYFINKSYFENPTDEQNEKWIKAFGFPESQYHFRTAWILFLNIGINGFGFTYEDIENAYMDKNKINHERQEAGY